MPADGHVQRIGEASKGLTQPLHRGCSGSELFED